MRTSAWIVVGKNGSIKVTKKSPTVPSNSVAMQLQINLPDTLFSKPKLVAQIEIPQESVGGEIISKQVIDNVADTLKQSTGLEFNVSVVSRKV